MRRSIIVVLLITITLLAALLRFPALDKIPSGFAIDEAAFGYNAYSILKTGRDEYGIPFPLNLKSFGDYKAAGYAYFAIPAIAIFGLSEFTTRLPSAIFGTLFVWVVYFLTKKLTKDIKISLIAAALTAICPSLIFLSRIQSDPLVSAFFVVLGIYLLLLWKDNKNIFFFLLSFFSFLISMLTYQSPRIFVPLFLVAFFLVYRTSLSKKQVLFSLGGFIGLGILIAFLMFSGGARYKQVSVFSQPEIRLVLEEELREDATTKPIITRLFHNKPIEYGRYLVENFFRHLDFDFLFYQANSPIRERVPNTGVLYLIDLPFLIYGAYLILHKKVRWGYILLVWILLQAFSLSFTFDESPNIHRFIAATIPLEIIIAFGITRFLQNFKKRPFLHMGLLVLIPFLYFYSVIYYFHELIVHQPVHQPWFRNSAYKEMVTEINKKYDTSKKFIITNTESNPYMFILFYNKYDPRKYQESGSNGNENYKGFDKYVFVPLNCPLYSGNSIDPATGDPEIVYIERGNCNNPPNVKITYLRWGDKSSAFKMMKLIPTAPQPTTSTNQE